MLLVAREALGWWLPSGPVSDEVLLSVFLSGLTNVSAVFLVGMLAGYLSEQARDAGQRLLDASRNLESLRALNGHIITVFRVDSSAAPSITESSFLTRQLSALQGIQRTRSCTGERQTYSRLFRVERQKMS